jgi:hypothetical protein
VIWIEAVTEPLELDAVTVYDVLAESDVGVPEIIPVHALRLTPAGSAGLTAYKVTFPVTVGVSGLMALFMVAAMAVWL